MNSERITRPDSMAFRICLAPMMDRTDRYFRYLLRLISPRIRLYTEMVTADAVLHGNRDRLLSRDASEQPVALQLGGSDPERLALAARHGEDAGFDEINLNCGCPSDRVQSGSFGACLLAQPGRVAEAIAAMRAAVSVPVTVKTRIALDQATPRSQLWPFIERVSAAGCGIFIIHARPAWLQGLSPKENREVPPLDYEVVAALKRDFPHLTLILNGGITTPEQITSLLLRFDGVMLGRAAYDNPYLFAEHDETEGLAVPTRAEVMTQFSGFAMRQISEGVPPRAVLRHVLGLYAGQPGARLFRRRITEALAQPLRHDCAPAAVLAGRVGELLDEVTAAAESRRSPLERKTDGSGILAGPMTAGRHAR